MKIFKILLITIIFTCTACTPHIGFLPEKSVLNDAVLHQPYSVKINIIGRPVISKSFGSEFYPSGSGLYLESCGETVLTKFNCVLIKGTPVKSGLVTLRLVGSGYIAMFESAPHFDKTYTINVLDHQHIYSEDE